MQLSTICFSCKEYASIKSKATDRPALIKDIGETFNLQCENCHKNHTVHVNDVRAQPDPKIMLLGLIVGVIITLLLWTILGAIGTISMSIPILIWSQQSNAAHSFNKYMTAR